MTTAEIIAALRAATGSDRSLDIDIAKAVRRDRIWKNSSSWMIKDENGDSGPIPEYTASNDAALAIAQHMLPEHIITMQYFPAAAAWCEVFAPSGLGGVKAYSDAYAPTLPLAILLAAFSIRPYCDD